MENISGLSTDEVEERIKANLSNRHTFDTSRSIATILRSNLLTLFNGVVGGAFAMLLVLGQWQDALFGLAVIANILIGVVQEFRSKVILDRLTVLHQKSVLVRRNGSANELPPEQLVVDDIIQLSAGDQLPVDALLLSTNNLEVDESLLSGEAEPVSKSLGDGLLSGSIVISGSGLAKVSKVGLDTYASKLVVEARSFSKVSSEIRESLDRLIRWISWALGPLIIVILFGQLGATSNPLDALVKSIASIISMVPQGLVLITSIAFAIAAVRLARRKVLLQELAAVEGLARVDVVCFDKTGTLTTGELEFHEAKPLFNSRTQSVASSDWQAVLAEFASQPAANKTARALGQVYKKSTLVVTESSDFSSERKWSSLTIGSETWTLGAPEILTEEKSVIAEAGKLAEVGMRVLLLTFGEIERIPWVLLSFKEEINPNAKQTMQYFKLQEVEVKVISGDHPKTVEAVAQSAGLITDVPGLDARNLSVDIKVLSQAMEKGVIFGRVTPDQKKLMIRALQESGHVVAMIGDGVNDALAIKQADIGIAMGSGASATRAVANLTLLENNFNYLPDVVAEGRQVIANVERLARLFLTKTTWAMILAIVFGFLVWEFPFLPRQLSAVDGYAIGIPAFLLAFLPNLQRYKAGFLKRALSFCIPAGLVTAAGVILLAVLIRSQDGWTSSAAQTATSILLSITGLGVLATLSRPLSITKLLIISTMVIVAIGAFVLPATVEFFGFSYLGQEQLQLTLTIGFVAVLLMALVDALIIRREEIKPA